MQLTELLTDRDRAVSPVIGVILMVAITVILAAVIGTFVLGLGDQVQTTAPNSNFATDYDQDPQELTITHDGGDPVDSSNLYLRGDVEDAANSDWPVVWSNASGISGDVTAGTQVEVVPSSEAHNNPGAWDNASFAGEPNEATIRVVWQDPGSQDSSTLATWSGPDA